MSQNKGFTLIELLVVVAVIGTLATIIVPNLGGSRIKAKDAAIVVETKQIITQVELATNATGNYSGVCDLFDESGNQLEKIKLSIEDKGGIWEDCVDSNDSYAVTVTLNAAQARHWIPQAFAQAELDDFPHPFDPLPPQYDGVHSREEVLLSDDDIKELRRRVKDADERFFEPQYYCTGVVPPYVSGGNFRTGYLYQLPTSGCGNKVTSYDEAQNSYSYATGGLSEVSGNEDSNEGGMDIQFQAPIL